MKTIAAAMALATLMAWPTVGDAASKKSKARAATPPKTFVQPRGQIGHDARRPRSSNPQWDVYWTNGGYSGTDPDPRIRMMLQIDDPFSGDS